MTYATRDMLPEWSPGIAHGDHRGFHPAPKTQAERDQELAQLQDQVAILTQRVEDLSRSVAPKYYDPNHEPLGEASR